jgi:transposase
MCEECNIHDVHGQHVYSGLDISKKSWRVSIYVGSQYYRSFTQPPHPEALRRYLEHNFPGAKYHSVYEAGYFGYWAHRQLGAMGIQNIVVHPADVPTTDKEHRRKNDPVDARKLSRSLSLGELRPLYVPSQQAEHDRSLIRMRYSFVKKQTRCKLQIKSLLTFSGIPIPDDMDERYWSRRFIAWLQQVRFVTESGTQALHMLIEELLFLRSQLLQLTRQIRELSRSAPYHRSVQLLQTIPGISELSAMMFLTEMIDIHRFRSPEHLASYAGLVPDEHSSGDTQQIRGISRRRNRTLRTQLVECAWITIHNDPVLAITYDRLAHRMGKNKAIIRIARKLLNRIRSVLIHQQPYRAFIDENEQ